MSFSKQMGTISGGAYPWEQIVSFVITGLICCTLFSLIGWTIKLQITQWKLPGTMVTERGRMEDRSNDMMRELRDKMDDMLQTRASICAY